MKSLIPILVLGLVSCAQLVTAGAAALGGGLAAALEAPAYIVAITAGGSALGTELYMEKVESEGEKEDLQDKLVEAAGGSSLFKGPLSFLSNILDFILGAAVVVLIATIVLRGPRKLIGKVIRGLSGNSAPKKWVTENWDRLNKHEELLEAIKSSLDKEL